MNPQHNPPRRAALIWTGIMALGIIVVFIPLIAGMNGADSGFAIAFLGGFVALVGLIAALIYARLAAVLDRITRKENLLAYWTYTPQQWQEYAEKEYTEGIAGRKQLYILLDVVSVIAGIIVGWFNRHKPGVIVVIVIGIIAVISVTAWLSAGSNYRRSRKYLGEAYLALDGVYLNRKLYIWKGIGNRLEAVAYEDTDPKQPIIHFEYSAPSEDGRDYYHARVPVPPGQEETARNIVAQVAAAHLGKKA